MSTEKIEIEEEGAVVAKTESRAIRKLTKEEHDVFSGSIMLAVSFFPSWRDILALLRPMYDPTAATAYVDPYLRVGLSPWFFDKLTGAQRATVLIHEGAHILFNHFERARALGETGGSHKMNLACDYEINEAIARSEFVELMTMVRPGDRGFPASQTQEIYWELVKNDVEIPQKCPVHSGPEVPDDQQGQPDNGSSGEGKGESGDDEKSSSTGSGAEGDEKSEESGKGSGGEGEGKGDEDCTCELGEGGDGQCDDLTDERENGADGAGIEKASEVDKSIARRNTATRIREEAREKRRQGNGAAADLLELMLGFMQPPKVDWRKIFRQAVASSIQAIVAGRTDYTYRRPSRRFAQSEFIFPGMVSYKPSVMIGVDTSGSMSADDYRATLYEVEGVLRGSSNGAKTQFFCIDTTIKDVKRVGSVKEINLTGGGGTDMSMGWVFVNSLKKKDRPDLFILATDGYTDWGSIEDQLAIAGKTYKSIILVTTDGGYDGVPDSVKRRATVINISLNS